VHSIVARHVIPVWHDPFIPLRDDSGNSILPRSTNNGSSYPDGRVDMRLHTLGVWRDRRVCESTVENGEEVGSRTKSRYLESRGR